MGKTIDAKVSRFLKEQVFSDVYEPNKDRMIKDIYQGYLEKATGFTRSGAFNHKIDPIIIDLNERTKQEYAKETLSSLKSTNPERFIYELMYMADVNGSFRSFDKIEKAKALSKLK